MKICPSCKETYTDDDLNFCLKDGSFLSTADPGQEPKTIYMDAGRATNPNWQQTPNYEPPTVWQNQQTMPHQPTMQHQPAGLHPLRIQSPNQTLPTISLILGILGLLTFCCHGGIPLGAFAVAAGLVGLNNEKSDPVRYGGRGLAMGGIITGALALTFGIVWLLMWITAN